MNVAFDVHNTLDNDEDGMLRGILNAFLERQWAELKVFIVSGPPKEQIKEELDALGIDYSNITIISVVDYLKRKGYYMWNTPKGWFTHPEVWWKAKGMICEEYNISMIFDDKFEYREHMPKTTKFVLWQGYRSREYYGKRGKNKPPEEN